MTTKTVAKPFLKWAGGKTQLLNSLVSRLPASIKSTGVIHSYIEPFVGGGALFFHLRANFCIEKSLLMDANRDLILAYKTIQQKPHELIVSLKEIEEEYLTLDDDKREEFYYRIRDLYNDEMHTFDYFGDDQRWVTRTTQLVFLNKPVIMVFLD